MSQKNQGKKNIIEEVNLDSTVELSVSCSIIIFYLYI